MACLPPSHYICCLYNELFSEYVKLRIGKSPETILEQENMFGPPTPYTMMAKQVTNPSKKWFALQRLLEKYLVKDSKCKYFYKTSLSNVVDLLDLMDGDWWEPPTKDDMEQDDTNASVSHNGDSDQVDVNTNAAGGGGAAVAGGGAIRKQLHVNAAGGGGAAVAGGGAIRKQLHVNAAEGGEVAAAGGGAEVTRSVKDIILSHNDSSGGLTCTLMRHRIGKKSTWTWMYNSDEDCYILDDGSRYKTLSILVNTHYRQTQAGQQKKMCHANSWKECEFYVMRDEVNEWRSLSDYANLTE